LLTQIVSPAHVQLIGKIREVLSNYKKNELLIRIGEYKPGSDKNADFAIKYIDKVNRFLKQQVEETCTLEETLQQLESLFK
jgi:type III secretion protein N (ATPase)